MLKQKQASLNTTEVSRQQCGVCFGGHATEDLTFPLADLWRQGLDGNGSWMLKHKQALLNTTEVTWKQCGVSFGGYATEDLTSPAVDLWRQSRTAEWFLDVARVRNVRTRVSEVGRDDGTAK